MSDGNNVPTQNRERRSSFTSNTLTALFGRNNSTSAPSAPSAPSGVAPQPGPVTAATTPGRRMSIAAIGLGTSPIQTSGFNFPNARRGSVSTAGSDSVDESAIEDDDGPAARSVPTTPFTRRMSFGAQALFNARGGGSSGTNAEGLNWSEQFRSRAESAVQRPSFSTSPTTSKFPTAPTHERAKSFSEMPSPPAAMPQQPSAPAPSALKRKPDAVGERILRGDFYMD